MIGTMASPGSDCLAGEKDPQGDVNQSVVSVVVRIPVGIRNCRGQTLSKEDPGPDAAFSSADIIQLLQQLCVAQVQARTRAESVVRLVTTRLVD